MPRHELDCLGTIAKPSTKASLEAQAACDGTSIYGRFGVGVVSAVDEGTGGGTIIFPKGSQ